MLEGCRSMPCIDRFQSLWLRSGFLAAQQVSSFNYYGTRMVGVVPATHTQTHTLLSVEHRLRRTTKAELKAIKHQQKFGPSLVQSCPSACLAKQVLVDT